MRHIRYVKIRALNSETNVEREGRGERGGGERGGILGPDVHLGKCLREKVGGKREEVGRMQIVPFLFHKK